MSATSRTSLFRGGVGRSGIGAVQSPARKCGQDAPKLEALRNQWLRAPDLTSGDRLFTFTRLPDSQWKSARTTNAIERLHEEFKRRIKIQTVLPSAETCLAALPCGTPVARRRPSDTEQGRSPSCAFAIMAVATRATVSLSAGCVAEDEDKQDALW